ncbi:recombination-associated protein RdgC [Pseudomonas abietaniphila]|uniref:Recombination-associated protein RdgC n=1 Tax=Pseudomonas abietaniphila TaxID=89065 RepID=A0A1G8QP83_9PSED|nr:recombination-associated protein RdgC [Pseudomonas abietaniphila]SDJ06497.1 recombination associated protein RdgC [Pseudomonas abietaniphila]
MFPSLHLYRMTEPWKLSPAELEKRLERKAFKPCAGNVFKSQGWVPPRTGGGLVFEAEKQYLLALCFEEKRVPDPVLQRHVAKKAAKMFADKGYKPSRDQLKALKEESMLELLPRAFEAQEIITIWINSVAGLIAIDTGTPGKADDVVTELLEAVSIPASLIRTAMDPSSAMSSWLMNNEAPDEFTVDREVHLQGLDLEKSKVSYAQLCLERDEVRQHILEGRRPIRLAMTFSENLSFVLTDKLSIKRIVFHDSIKAEIPDAEDETEAFAGSFLTYAGHLSKLVPALLEALGGEDLAQ